MKKLLMISFISIFMSCCGCGKEEKLTKELYIKDYPAIVHNFVKVDDYKYNVYLLMKDEHYLLSDRVEWRTIESDLKKGMVVKIDVYKMLNTKKEIKEYEFDIDKLKNKYEN